MAEEVVDLSHLPSGDEEEILRLPGRVHLRHGEFYTVTLPRKPESMPRPQFIAHNDPRQGGKLVRNVKNGKKRGDCNKRGHKV